MEDIYSFGIYWGLPILLFFLCCRYFDSADYIRRYAKRIGFEETPEDKSLNIMVHGFPRLFNEPRNSIDIAISKNYGNVIVTIFKYNFVYHHSYGKVTYARENVCLFRDSELKIPNFRIRSEYIIIDTVSSMLGSEDIDFPDDPDFSSAFLLQGENENEIRAFFDPGVRKAFMQFRGTEDRIEGACGVLAVRASTFIGSFKRIDELCEETARVYDICKRRAEAIEENENRL